MHDWTKRIRLGKGNLDYWFLKADERRAEFQFNVMMFMSQEVGGGLRVGEGTNRQSNS